MEKGSKIVIAAILTIIEQLKAGEIKEQKAFKEISLICANITHETWRFEKKLKFIKMRPRIPLEGREKYTKKEFRK